MSVRQPFTFNLRDDAKLLSITLPSAWCAASVGKLQAFLACKRGLEAYAVHMLTSRGVADTHMPVRACIVPGEEVVLARGPPPTHSEASSTRRTLWVWGRTVDGDVLSEPMRQPRLWPHHVVGVALGTEHALVVTDAGLVLSWGSNSHGQLGNGGDGNPWQLTRRPRLVRALAEVHCASVSCGAHCSAAIASATGALYTWGHNQASNTPTHFESAWVNRHGATPCGRASRAIAFGRAHALLLSDCDEAGDHAPGRVWTFGYNELCQLGWPEAAGGERGATALRAGFQKPTRPLELGSPAAAVACGAAHSAAVLVSGTLLCWGDNARGQCGTGTGAPFGRLVATPERATVLETEPVAVVHCCGGTTVAVLASGRAYMLGGGGMLQQDGRDDAADSADDDSDADGDGSDGGDGDEGDEARDSGGTRRGGGGGGGPSASELADGSGSGGQGGLLARLGGLAEAKRLLAEGVRGAALCDDHALLLGDGNADAPSILGAGYNRYGQCAPGDPRLRVPLPTPLPAALLGGQVPVAIAVGGGGSAVLTTAAETLAARCRAVLRAELGAGNAACCAQLLALLVRCEAPWLSPLAEAITECVVAQRTDVERVCASVGVVIDEALDALARVSAA